MASAEILTVEEMSAADQAAIHGGVPGSVLMERAGGAVADAIMQRYAPRSVVVLCGPGSNGGDGYVAARRLQNAGWRVSVAAAGPPKTPGDAAAAAKAWPGPAKALTVECLDGAGLVVDALFGAGLKRPLDDAAAGLLAEVASRSIPLVAVDVPSGLDADTGVPLGYAPQADLTVTFHRKKKAHVLEPGKGLCGVVVVADIGLTAPDPGRLFENGPAVWGKAFPWPAVEGFKSRRGHLMVVSGRAAQTGAARLACRAGLRVGAGLVTMLSPPGALLVNAMHLEAVMLAPFRDLESLGEASAKATAVVIGPAVGVGDKTRANLWHLKAQGLPLVVDADALTSFQEDPQTLFSALEPRDVLTPHPGEFERVFPGLLNAGPDRVAAARAASGRAGAVVLLKGADTAIAAPDGRCVVNTNGTPWLATAGSGDVLAGLIGGLIAQGMESFLAACAGAWIHAAAAHEFGPGLISEDLPNLVPKVLKQIYLGRNEM